MCEILFRGKRVDNGEWVYGYLLKIDDDYFISNGKTEIKGVFILDNGESKTDFTGLLQVIPETIGQYTGIEDKNGKKIFEGDILREYSNEIEDWTVSYEYGKFFGTFDNICEDLYEISDFEVIGTIFDKEDNGEE